MTRIIAGAAGSLRLEVPRSGTRPTSDRVREAIFSTLESWGLVSSTRVCDLYAGSGALGLEALSRGAAHVVLVEKNPQAAAVAKRNAAVVQRAVASHSEVEVVKSSVQSFLGNMSEHVLFDVVLIDPPYDIDEETVAADLYLLAPHLCEDGVLLIERSSRSPEPSWPDSLQLLREKRYGETVLWWAERI